MRGKFITFEGCEGVGKSKQVKLLKQYLEEKGLNPLVLREPGGTFVSERIRDVILDTANYNMTPKCELILYIAARAQLVEEIIRPAIEQGRLVICDRFIDSTFSYQGFGRGLEIEMVNALNKIAIEDCEPDLTIFLDLEPEQAFKRKGGADKSDRLESENIKFHNKVYQGYKYLESKNSERVVAIKPIGTVKETHNKIIQLLESKGMIV